MSDPIPIRKGVDPYGDRKTVSVSFQLRVPKGMRAVEVSVLIKELLSEDRSRRLVLYKNRVEIFSP